MIDLRRVPEVPLWCARPPGRFLILAGVQLLPLPQGLRRLVQPGFAEVMATGWAPLSLAPWSTIQVVASTVVAAGIALTAARMTSTRSGLPTLLGVIAVTCGVISVLGLAGESGAPERVLLIRANTGGGDVYGPFVNSNHFAAAIELSLPAALVLLAAAVRNLPRPGAHPAARRRNGTRCGSRRRRGAGGCAEIVIARRGALSGGGPAVDGGPVAAPVARTALALGGRCFGAPGGCRRPRLDPPSRSFATVSPNC